MAASEAQPELLTSEERGPAFQLLAQLCRRSDFLLSAVSGSLALTLAYYLLLLRETTIHTMLTKLGGEPVYLILLALLAACALVIFGLNTALTGMLLRARIGVAGQGGSLLGIIAGGFGVGCPSCGAFLLSLVGVTAGLSVLPFGGLELWFVSCLVMGFTFWRSLHLLQSRACSPTETGSSCDALPPVSWTQVWFLGATGLLLAGALAWIVTIHDPASIA